MTETHRTNSTNPIEHNSILNLPYTYQQIDNSTQAHFQLKRFSQRLEDGQTRRLTDQEILTQLQKQKQKEKWYTSEYWRQKHDPHEQIKLIFDNNNHEISLYNYNNLVSLTDEHTQKISSVLGEVAARYPQIINQVRWVLIDNNHLPSLYGDPDKYPTNGIARIHWQAIQLFPRGIELFPFRLPVISNLEGVLTHELAHFLDEGLLKEWRNAFAFPLITRNKDWIKIPTPNGSSHYWKNTITGEISPRRRFPKEPQQCITDYAKIDPTEDLCESVVASIYAPELLKEISPRKFSILRRHAQQLSISNIVINRIPPEQISLPQVEPETVLYYVDESHPEIM